MISSGPQRLYHFTCDYGARAIGARGLIIPQIEHVTLGCKVSWFTVLAMPDRQKTGLTMHLDICDRMAFRYVIDGRRVALCEPWIGSEAREGANPVAVRDLEEGHDPENWWISEFPVPSRLG